jgi:hypothetical protein
MTDYAKKYLIRLQKRRDFLAERVANNPNLTYDKAEMSALTWAIEQLAGYYNLDENFNEQDIY